MIYCPHCSRPTARKSGPCPHCKGDLTGKAPAPSPSQPKQAQPSQVQQETKTNGEPRGDLELSGSSLPSAELDTSYEGAPSEGGDDSSLEIETNADSSGLVLENVDLPVSQEVDPAEEEVGAKIDSLTIREAAGYGNPGTGIPDAFKYWLRVRQRQKELVVETEEAIKKFERAANRKLETTAALGRKGFEIGLSHDSFNELVSKARIAAGDLEGSKKRSDDLAAEHQSALAPLEAQLKIVEAEAAPLRERERLALEEHTKLATVHKGIAVQLKRVEIEIRNIDDIIRRKQEEYANSEKQKQEKDKLLFQISSMDNKKPALAEQARGLEEKLAVAAEPLGKAEANLNEVREELGEKLKKIGELTGEMKRLATKFSSVQDDAKKELDSEHTKLEEAWAAVGDRIIVLRPNNPEIQDLLSETGLAKTGFSDARLKVEVLEQAINSYDADVVSKAKKLLIAAAVGVVVLIVLLIVLVG